MKNIFHTIISNLISAVLTLIGLAIVGLWLLYQSALVQFLLPLQSSTIFGFGWILAVFLLLLTLAVAYIVYLRKNMKVNLFSACGVCWDIDFNPVCPSCEKRLVNYAFYRTSPLNERNPGMQCFDCDKVVHFSNEEKIFMKLEEAREKAKRHHSGNKNQ